MNIFIIGSGNVATHLARGFHVVGNHIIGIYSRDITHASRLADEFDACLAYDVIAKIPQDADFYLIALSDTAIEDVVTKMPQVGGLVAHTSGSIPLETLSRFQKSAVLYPLQTFTRQAQLSLSEIPFFTEAKDNLTYNEVDSLAKMLSDNVYHANSQQRKTLHIAGVLSCNFVNYLWDCAAQLLNKDGYDFAVVKPLIDATLKKAVEIGPHNAQTGPAVRKDFKVIENHASMLDDAIAQLYIQLSQAIINSHE